MVELRYTYILEGIDFVVDNIETGFVNSIQLTLPKIFVGPMPLTIYAYYRSQKLSTIDFLDFLVIN